MASQHPQSSLPSFDPSVSHEYSSAAMVDPDSDSESNVELANVHTKLNSDHAPSPDGSASTKRKLALVSLVFLFVGSNIPSFFTGPALNYIATDLQIGSERSWITTSANLATASIVPVCGYIQDLIGRRGTLAVGLLILLVGIIVTATANGFASLIAGSVLHGIGTGIEELTSIAAIAELVPINKRGFVFGAMTLLMIIFTPSLIYASELSIHASWRWLYWIAFIWNGVATTGTAFTYFTMDIKRERPASVAATAKAFDYVGILMLIAGVTELLIAVQAGGISHPWNSAYVIVQLVVGVALIGGLILWEIYFPQQPLIPTRLFKGQRAVSLCFIIAFFSGAIHATGLSLGPTIIMTVFQLSTSMTGLLSLPAAFCLTIGTVATNLLLSSLKGNARELLVVGAIIMTAFTGAQACIEPWNYGLWAALAGLSNLGTGAVLVPLQTVLTVACPEDLIGIAIGLIICVRTVGGSIGYAILYNVWTTHVETYTGEAIAKAAVGEGLPTNEAVELAKAFLTTSNPTSPTVGSNVTQDQAILGAAHYAYQETAADASKLVYYSMIAFGVVVIFSCAALPQLKKLGSNKVLI